MTWNYDVEETEVNNCKPSFEQESRNRHNITLINESIIYNVHTVKGARLNNAIFHSEAFVCYVLYKQCMDLFILSVHSRTQE